MGVARNILLRPKPFRRRLKELGPPEEGLLAATQQVILSIHRPKNQTYVEKITNR